MLTQYIEHEPLFGFCIVKYFHPLTCVGLMIPEWREGLFPQDTKKHELILAIDSESHTDNMDKLMLK